jgi:glycosyltransferase involved in cell wall biosynthesis
LKKKNILIITPIYPGAGINENFTKVVAYFAESWAKSNNVVVFHVFSKFPKLYYSIGKSFKDNLSSIMGHPIPISSPENNALEIKSRALKIFRIGMPKLYPGQVPSKKKSQEVVNKIIYSIDALEFNPDVAVGHWLHPSSGILSGLSNRLDIKTNIVIHMDPKRRNKYYTEAAKNFLTHQVSGIGFRSHFIKDRFEEKYPQNCKHKFYCPSGLPDDWINKTIGNKNFKSKTLKIIFVGSLIKRKYPSVILDAINNNSEKFIYKITFIGEGREAKTILKKTKKYSFENQVEIKGHIQRQDVLNQMNNSHIFIMISKKEAFGLVYIEAMTKGLIVIASRNEGMDGIIVNGVNGFLCKSGDYLELSKILNEINKMSNEELNIISKKAQKTSQNFTETKVSSEYLMNILK